jgi:hypothetical protein
MSPLVLKVAKIQQSADDHLAVGCFAPRSPDTAMAQLSPLPVIGTGDGRST